MKKIVFLTLVAVLLLSLSACGDKAAMEVDNQILDIGTITLDSGSAIQNARNAYEELPEESKSNVSELATLESAEGAYQNLYGEINSTQELISIIGVVSVESGPQILSAREAFNALSETEQNYVENYDVLCQAEEDYFNLKYTDVCGWLSLLNETTEAVCNTVELFWDNVGAENFFTYYNAVRTFEDETSIETIEQASGEGAWVVLLQGAGYAFGHASSPIASLSIPESEYDTILEKCYAFNTAYKMIDELRQKTEENLDVLAEVCGETENAKITLLNDWFVQSSLFADFALEPAGSLASYRSDFGNYVADMSYYNTAAGR